MLDLFNRMGESNSRNMQYQFQDNQPKVLFSQEFTQQKLDEVHNNPVVGLLEIELLD